MITLYPELAIAIIIVVCVFSLKCASLVLFWNFTIRCSACLNLVPYVIFLDVRLGIVCFRKMVVGISSTEIYLDFEDCYFYKLFVEITSANGLLLCSPRQK